MRSPRHADRQRLPGTSYNQQERICGKPAAQGRAPSRLRASTRTACSPCAAEHIRDRAAARGIASTSGTHADGTWIEFLDPDGIAIRVIHSPTLADSFFGVVFGTGAEPEFYDVPRLDLSGPDQAATH
ncbi:hypothetical protein [Marmoricola sp. URHB0036]|uniref:hypothetical protein n=1 Tax=Marmoricola sp. URHB0036 TaxID=1298863 RepID=UPI0012DF68CE|nr:hypothetical protein [Marmoricola sp. URHB0036]